MGENVPTDRKEHTGFRLTGWAWKATIIAYKGTSRYVRTKGKQPRAYAIKEKKIQQSE